MTLTFSTERLKHLLLQGHALVYLIAFSSLYYQIPGLYGENGVAPVANVISKCKVEDIASCKAPILFAIHKYAGVRPSNALQITCLKGIALALLALFFSRARNFITYTILVLFYLTCIQVGNTFLYFQWDSLLVESGWLMVVLSAFTDSPADIISTFLVRFLAARLMFASGVVKLQSQCPTWWGLTALDIHFESQCLPTPLAWFFHHMPQWVREAGVAWTFFIEIFLPPLFLLPFPLVRWLAAIPQIVFMIFIQLSGNYNFFNFHYALLAFACCEGFYYSSVRSSSLSRHWIALSNLISLILFGGAFFLFYKSFSPQIDFTTMTMKHKLVLTGKEFDELVRIGTSVLVHLAVIGFAWSTLNYVYLVYKGDSLVRKVPVITPKQYGAKGKAAKAAAKETPKFTYITASRIPAILHGIFVLVLGSIIFWTAFVPFTQIDKAASNRIPDIIRAVHQKLKPLELTNSYGLFRRMTGVEGRPEVIFEGSHEPNGPWKEIEFYTKPGRLSGAPLFVAPHQPRLDWQMWFAALGAYQHNPWFLSLTNRLLHNDTNVIGLLSDSWPFKDEKKPLKFLRAQLYMYRYTERGAKNWWTRALQHEYMPVQAKDTPALLEYLRTNNLLNSATFKDSQADNILDSLHRIARQYSQRVFVWSILLVAIVLAYFS